MVGTRWIDVYPFKHSFLRQVLPFYEFLKAHALGESRDDPVFTQRCEDSVKDLCDAMHEFLGLRATMEDLASSEPLSEEEFKLLRKLQHRLAEMERDDPTESQRKDALAERIDKLAARIITTEDLAWMRQLNYDIHELLDEIRDLIDICYEAHGFSLVGQQTVVYSKRVPTPVRSNLRNVYVNCLKAIETEKTRGSYLTFKLPSKLHVDMGHMLRDSYSYAEEIRTRVAERFDSPEYAARMTTMRESILGNEEK
jgi:hypothetical protein